MPSIPEALKELLNNIAALSAVLGFGLLGVLVAAKKLFINVRGLILTYTDKRYFKDRYLHCRELAVRDGCYSRTEAKSLVTAIQELKESVTSSIVVSLQDRLRVQLARHASGSTTLTMGDLVREEKFRLPLRFLDHRSEEPINIATLYDRLLRAGSQPGPTAVKYVLRGGAGWGKSLACLWMVAKSTLGDDAALDGKVILLITVEDVGTNDALGSEAWLIDAIARRVGRAFLSDLQREVVADFIHNRSLIVIDGLDEFYERLGTTAGDAFTTSWVFERAHLIATRTSHYEASLRGMPIVRRHEILDIPEASMHERLAFINEVCRTKNEEGAASQMAAIVRVLEKSTSLEQVSRAPLILMMLTEIPASDLGLQGSFRSVDIYRTFIDQLMQRDSGRLRDVSSPDELASIYRRLALCIYETIRNHERALGALDIAELRNTISAGNARTLSEVRQLETAILDSPLLRVSRADPADKSSILVAFAHESFLEFQVASLVSHWARGLEQEGASFFDFLESPGVSVFLKEYIDKLKSNPSSQARARTALLDLLDQLAMRLSVASSERDGRIAVFALGQVSYYLGMLANDTVASKLTNLASTNHEFWVRRCAAIGLAFGGRSSEFDKMVDELVDATDRGDFYLPRKNIAIELAFYGDQPFNRLDPCADSGLPDCRRLVSTVVREMQLEIEAPNWRMGLFNLFYLAFFRPESAKSFLATISEYRDELLRLVERQMTIVDHRSSRQLSRLKALLESDPSDHGVTK